MEGMRKPIQGVWNVVRFNWHYYGLAAGGLWLLTGLGEYFGGLIRVWFVIFSALALVSILVSLLVSYYVYDLSNLYKLDWFGNSRFEAGTKVVNINAGFDETSEILKAKFPEAKLVVLDYYDPEKHTEVSIKRARKAYPPFPNTLQVTTSKLQLENDSVDAIFVILSAHEIRNDSERTRFFAELRRILKPEGRIFVTEHLRDMPNFLAYNIGALHFLSRKTWFETFAGAGLRIFNETKITPFITTFTLEKNGTSS